MGIYKIGFCPVCGEQIQIQDCMGRWTGIRPNFRQVDMVWPDGHRCRSIICNKCVKSVTPKELYDIVIAPNSEASNRQTLDTLEKRGEPSRLAEVKNGN